MLHVLKWAQPQTRMFFRPDDGAGAGSASSGDGGSSGGDGGGSPPVSTPSDGGGSPPTPPSPDSGGPIEDWSMLGSTDDLDEITHDRDH